MTQLLNETEDLSFVEPYTEDSDPKRRTHIINPAANIELQTRFGRMDAQEIVKTARFFKIEIVALCGYRFIPEHNPESYDSCDKCLTIANQIMSEDG